MSLARAQDQLVGRSLGEFVLRERIGEGGFGAVYRATQPALDREAVIKVLHSKLHASTAAAERFLREAKLASKLDHPYAAHIYAFGAEPDGELWIAMELVRGTPLDQVLRLQGPLPLERMAQLLDRICEVVHTAHEAGIVHRDLKPANVMVLARAGRLLPKLLDFGIAKGLAGGASESSLDETMQAPSFESAAEPDANTMPAADTPSTPQLHNLTQRGAIMGSPPYMAPEQWIDAGHVDARTDLYALGVLAYECLTGKPPFTGATITAIAYAHAKQPVPALGSRFPPALDKVLAKVLAKKANDRYPDALAFATAFRQASGIATEAVNLPTLERARRDAAVNDAPQPIAEAVAALEATRNAHQARDAVAQIARTIARYLGLVALACRSRITIGDEPPEVVEAMRMLHRRSLPDLEWIELAKLLTQPWGSRREAYPVPELVDALADRNVIGALENLIGVREREAHGDDALIELLEKSLAQLGQLLGALGFLANYPLVVAVAGGVAERWMGTRRAQRLTTAVRGKGLEPGSAGLLDSDGVPVLTLSPLFQVAAPTPGAPLELFLFDGRDARGAKLIALPGGFEHHDDALWDWFRAQLAGSLDDTRAAVAEEVAPYRGLAAFSADDGARFFGREKLVDAFANRLQLQPLLAVVGRSGAGKSSFVQAGVIPALPRGWRTITMRPGASPLGALIARLEHAELATLTRDAIARDRDVLGAALREDAARHGPLLLVVDQLEEMFTLCQDADERRVFAEAVAAAARSADDPVRVIFTLRDDFLVRTEQVPALRNRIGQGLQLLTVPVAEDLRRILVEPARRAGYEFEDPELPAEMVKEVADQPGALALISFTAAKLWELRDRHFKQLTRKAYRSLGGVGGALARHADITLDAMPPEERALAREAFRHLVTTQNTRAVITRKDLRQLLGSTQHADRVIEGLVAARLLVASENESGAETIEIIHEALLSTWPRLVEWRREDADGARFREQLRAAASQWDERKRERGLLWRGDALADFTRWRSRNASPLTDVEAAVTDASLGDAARGRRNRRLLLASAFTTLAVIVVGLIVLNTRIAGQRRELHDNLQRQFEDQGRRLVLASDPLQALAYLAKARELGASGPAHDFLVAQAVRASDGELFEVHHDVVIRSPRFSPDGTRFITGSFDRSARIWDARTGARQLTLQHRDTVVRASFSPDGKTALTGSFDGTAVVWDGTTGAPVQTFHHDGKLWCAAYSPDGSLVVTAGEDDTLAIWELPSGKMRFRARGGGAGFRSCTFSADGHTVAAGDAKGTVRVWSATSAEPTHVLATQGRQLIHGVAFTPDSTRLAAASFDGTVAVWNPSSGEPLYTVRHDGAVESVEFSSNNAMLVTASDDRTAVLWDAKTGAKLRALAGHSAGVNRAVFSPDGRYVVTASTDASAWLWEVETGRVAARWRGHRDNVFDADFDRSGQHVVTGGDDATAIVWEVAPQEPVTWLIGHRESVYTAQFSPDGRSVVTASRDGTARVWAADTGKEIEQFAGHGASVNDARFSPSGTEIASGGDDGSVRIWQVANPSIARALPGKGAVKHLAWTRDGERIAAATEDGYLRCWEARTGRLLFEVRAHNGYQVWSVEFTPDGQLITSGDDNWMRIWDSSGHKLREFHDPDNPISAEADPTGKRVLSVVSRQSAKIWDPNSGAKVRELVGHAGLLNRARWSPDGARVITASLDGTARLWDAATGETLAIFNESVNLEDSAFSPDGKRIVTAHDNGKAAIRELAHYAGSEADLDQLLRCRVPFEVQGDYVTPRERERSACRR